MWVPLQLLNYHVVPDKALMVANMMDGDVYNTLDGAETLKACPANVM